MKEITIKVEEYIGLLMCAEESNRLSCGGVDNWEWYGEAMHPDDQPSLDEFRKELEKQYLDK